MKGFFLALCLLVSWQVCAQAQCNELEISKQVAARLMHFDRVKQFRFDGKGGQRQQIEYTVLLKRQKLYSLVLDSGTKEGVNVFIRILSPDRKVLTTNKVKGKLLDHVEFSVPKFGVYYVLCTFEDNDNFCAYGELGMQDKH